MNFPNRVPVLAKPQDGSSIRNVSSAANIWSLLDAFMRTSLRNGRLHSFRRSGHCFLWQFCAFRSAKYNRSLTQRTKGSQRKTSVMARNDSAEVSGRVGGPLDFAL